MRRGLTITAFLLMLITITGCRKVPGYVIPPDDMSRLMADIHMAESVIESNYNLYPTDSTKMLLKQSVLANHGYNLQQLDTSLLWYGAHLDVYSNVYDRTIEILEKRMEESGIEEVRRQRAEMGSDSVDIWYGPRFMLIKRTTPSRYITYSYPADSTWVEGDMFTWRAKMTNVSENPLITLSADYEDGSTELLNVRLTGDGWKEATFITDSLKTAKRIYGSIMLDASRSAMVVDSIEFIRKPMVPRLYSQRYKQRNYRYVTSPEPVIEPDTLSAESDETIAINDSTSVSTNE